jgi:hypothetical protein
MHATRRPQDETTARAIPDWPATGRSCRSPLTNPALIDQGPASPAGGACPRCAAGRAALDTCPQRPGSQGWSASSSAPDTGTYCRARRATGRRWLRYPLGRGVCLLAGQQRRVDAKRMSHRERRMKHGGGVSLPSGAGAHVIANVAATEVEVPLPRNGEGSWSRSAWSLRQDGSSRRSRPLSLDA